MKNTNYYKVTVFGRMLKMIHLNIFGSQKICIKIQQNSHNAWKSYKQCISSQYIHCLLKFYVFSGSFDYSEFHNKVVNFFTY